jgi:PKD repeat protein
VRCYTQSFAVNISYAGTIGATSWSSDSRSERFASANVDLTVYVILDNTAGAYTYIVPRFRRYPSGTSTNLSTSRMHIRRLLPHYEGGYETAASPGLPDAPVADFEADSTTVAARASILFGNTTTGTVTSYAWTFGDGTTSTDESPSKAYASAGTYTVSLTATGPGGNDTETKTSYITVT